MHPPTLVWLTQAFTFFWWNWGETHHQLIHSTDTVVYPKQRPPSSPHCAEVVSLFATAVVSHTLLYFLSFMGISRLPISSEPSVIGFYWSVTVFRYFFISKFTGFWGSLEKLLVENTGINQSSWFNHICCTQNCISAACIDEAFLNITSNFMHIIKIKIIQFKSPE